MQNQFLPEETPQYHPPAPVAQQAETTRKTLTTEKAARQTAWLRQLKRQHKKRAAEYLFSGIAIMAFLWAFGLMLQGRFLHRAGFVGCIMAALAMALMTLWNIVVNGRKPLLTPERIQQIEGGGAVGALLDMKTPLEFAKDRDAIRAALTQCLPQIKADAPISLNVRQRNRLMRNLRANALLSDTEPESVDFCIAALKALEYTGVASDISTVEKIAAMTATTPNPIRVRDAAAECLPLLKARAGLVAGAQILLRASAPEPAGRDALLRPASGGGATDPDELLRPSDSGE